MASGYRQQTTIAPVKENSLEALHNVMVRSNMPGSSAIRRCSTPWNVTFSYTLIARPSKTKIDKETGESRCFDGSTRTSSKTLSMLVTRDYCNAPNATNKTTLLAVHHAPVSIAVIAICRCVRGRVHACQKLTSKGEEGLRLQNFGLLVFPD